MRTIRTTLLVVLASATLLLGHAHAAVTTRVSLSSVGNQVSSPCLRASISGDGRFVAFQSNTALVPTDTNYCADVYVHDRLLGATERVSVSSSGVQGDGSSQRPSISADGRYVAFYSQATNLVSGDTNNRYDVFVRDRQTGTTERVSVSSAGVQGTGDCDWPVISADGRCVAFRSTDTNLVTGDTNAKYDVYVRDRVAARTERVSVSSTGVQGNNTGGEMGFSLSADGRYVAFESASSNLIPGGTHHRHVYVRDRQAGTLEVVSLAVGGSEADQDSFLPSISSNGRYVAFTSVATNLVDGDTNGKWDVFVRDRQAGTTERVSVSGAVAQTDLNNDSLSHGSAISADGRYVVFESDATNLVPGDTNASTDLFVRDRQTGATERISVSTDGLQLINPSLWGSVSADGRYIAFESLSAQIVPGDTNRTTDVFVRDMQSIAVTKGLPDGEDVVLSANTIVGVLSGCFYAEDLDRSAGIKVSWSEPITAGYRYRVDGTLATGDDGERYIAASNVRRIDAFSAPAPVGLSVRNLGGTDKAFNPLTGNGQQGITSAYGLNNIGLLIKTWGKVTQVGTGYLYLNDGSDTRDGTVTGTEENVGVRVICDSTGYAPGDNLEVIGISSCFVPAPDCLARRIVVRTPLDMRKITQ